jgi:membrane protease YdiL (CAAX protease family)
MAIHITAPRPIMPLLVHWRPDWPTLGVVGLSWLLVVAALRTATSIVTAANGVLYFLVYAILGATVFGLGLPLLWMVVIKKRSLADLGLTTRQWPVSVSLQALFAVLLYASAFRGLVLPPLDQLAPLAALALTIGFFEAVFWRGWVLLRLEESFGLAPAIVVGSLLYAAYHIGYAMRLDEMVFLFFIGVLFAVTFRLTKSVLILWPAFQPLGQLVTLIQDGLSLPLIAALGFGEVLLAMLALVWLARRAERARRPTPAGP